MCLAYKLWNISGCFRVKYVHTIDNDLGQTKLPSWWPPLHRKHESWSTAQIHLIEDEDLLDAVHGKNTKRLFEYIEAVSRDFKILWIVTEAGYSKTTPTTHYLTLSKIRETRSKSDLCLILSLIT